VARLLIKTEKAFWAFNFISSTWLKSPRVTSLFVVVLDAHHFWEIPLQCFHVWVESQTFSLLNI
jgi:hypothetical protein